MGWHRPNRYVLRACTERCRANKKICPGPSKDARLFLFVKRDIRTTEYTLLTLSDNSQLRLKSGWFQMPKRPYPKASSINSTNGAQHGMQRTRALKRKRSATITSAKKLRRLVGASRRPSRHTRQMRVRSHPDFFPLAISKDNSPVLQLVSPLNFPWHGYYRDTSHDTLTRERERERALAIS